MPEKEMLKPQKDCETLADEEVRGVVLDPDSIRELLTKIKAQEAGE